MLGEKVLLPPNGITSKSIKSDVRSNAFIHVYAHRRRRPTYKQGGDSALENVYIDKEFGSQIILISLSTPTPCCSMPEAAWSFEKEMNKDGMNGNVRSINECMTGGFTFDTSQGAEYACMYFFHSHLIYLLHKWLPEPAGFYR